MGPSNVLSPSTAITNGTSILSMRSVMLESGLVQGLHRQGPHGMGLRLGVGWVVVVVWVWGGGHGMRTRSISQNWPRCASTHRQAWAVTCRQAGCNSGRLPPKNAVYGMCATLDCSIPVPHLYCCEMMISAVRHSSTTPHTCMVLEDVPSRPGANRRAEQQAAANAGCSTRAQALPQQHRQPGGVARAQQQGRLMRAVRPWALPCFGRQQWTDFTGVKQL